jgi:hypothetical protein
MVLLFGVALILTGCSQRESLPVIDNYPPETSIIWETVDTADGRLAIHASWSGTDQDGVVDHFEVATISILAGDDLSALDYEALQWRATTAVETIIVMADDLTPQSENAGSSGHRIRVLIVRAVDDCGATDREPARAFQIGEADMPKVTILLPPLLPIDPLFVCYRFYLEWEGFNPNGDEAQLSYKYLIIPESDLSGGAWERNGTGPRAPLPPLDNEGGTDHTCPPIGLWSHWVPADCTYVTDVDLSAYAGSGENLLVVVTARDQAGSVLEKVFYKPYNKDRNWFRCITLATCPGVRISIEEQMLGTRASVRQLEYETEVAYIYDGTEILFRFWADENRGRAEIAKAYRCYFDDPNTPTWDFWTPVGPLRREGYSPEWVVRFPGNGMPLAPGVGLHEFVLEVADIVDISSRCEFHLEVLEGPQNQTERLVYLVDDSRGAWMEPAHYPYEDDLDSLWADILEGYDYEVHDTGVHYNNAVSPQAMGQASTVIWNADYDIDTPTTNLLEICAEYNNYLYSYVKTGGNLIIIGKDPIYAHLYWPDGHPSPDFRAMFTSLDFSPAYRQVDSTWIDNFNWEILGIAEMELAFGTVRFSTLHPCETGWNVVDLADSLGWIFWHGVLDNAFFVTDVRTDITVHTLYGVVPLDAGGQPGPPDCTRWLGVYVPGDGTRGHAAYIGIDPWVCNRDHIKTLIRQLLTLFGE